MKENIMKIIALFLVSCLISACQPSADKTVEEKKAQLAIPYTQQIPDVGAEKLIIRKPMANKKL